jgi:hypothetical protein
MKAAIIFLILVGLLFYSLGNLGYKMPWEIDNSGQETMISLSQEELQGDFSGEYTIETVGIKNFPENSLGEFEGDTRDYRIMHIGNSCERNHTCKGSIVDRVIYFINGVLVSVVFLLFSDS